MASGPAASEPDGRLTPPGAPRLRPSTRSPSKRRCRAATVSRVLSGAKFVSGELAQRVWHAVSELEYRPNHIARNLRARATSTIGVVIPDIQNPFFTSVVRGIEDALQVEKFTLLLANSDGDPSRERVCLDTLCAEEVAGLVFVPCNAEPRAYEDLGTAGRAGSRDRPFAGRPQRGSRRRDQRRGRPRCRPAPGSSRTAAHRPHWRATIGQRRRRARAGLSRGARPGEPVRYVPALVVRADFREEGGYQAMVSLLNRPVLPMRSLSPTT